MAKGTVCSTWVIGPLILKNNIFIMKLKDVKYINNLILIFY